MKNILLLALLMSCFGIKAQTNYNDVAVIINDNSSESLEIAHYFQTARNIPMQNMIYLSITPGEEISMTGLNLLKDTIYNYLSSHGLLNNINYLVTTKGVPLKTTDALCSPGQGPCASIESELTLLKGAMSGQIGLTGQPANPYYDLDKHIADTSLGIYLVTRLDGYSVQAVKNMIDRSGPNTPINDLTGNVVVDISNTENGSNQVYYEALYEPAYLWANSNGWNAIYHPDLSRFSNQSNVVAYSSITHVGETSSLGIQFAKGSIAEVVSANEYETFDAGNPNGDQSIADFVGSGLTGGHGYVNPIFTSTLLNTEVLFSRYLDSSNHYNLAESYFMAEPVLSYMGVVVGDPKTSIVYDQTASLIQDAVFLSVYPNPANSTINYSVAGQQIEEVKLFNAEGKEIGISKIETSSNSGSISSDKIASGIYLLEITTNIEVVMARMVVR